MVAIGTVVTIVGGALGLVIVVIGGIFFYFRKKKGAKFPFLLYSKDGKNVMTIHGNLRTDPENRSNKRFFFSTLDCSLEIREPTKWINGKPHREIILNRLGEYNYLENTTVDEEKYLRMSVRPEEKSLAIFRFKENTRRFENPMNKAQAYMLVGMVILTLILASGIIYSTVSYVKIGGTHVTLAKENQKISASNSAISQSIERSTEVLKIYK
jgi:hypothetical protein